MEFIKYEIIINRNKLGKTLYKISFELIKHKYINNTNNPPTYTKNNIYLYHLLIKTLKKKTTNNLEKNNSNL